MDLNTQNMFLDITDGRFLNQQLTVWQNPIEYFEGNSFPVSIKLLSLDVTSSIVSSVYLNANDPNYYLLFVLGNISPTGILSIYVSQSLFYTASTDSYTGSIFVTGSVLSNALSGSEFISGLLKIEYRNSSSVVSDKITIYEQPINFIADVIT